jgi:hypothetical protein
MKDADGIERDVDAASLFRYVVCVALDCVFVERINLRDLCDTARGVDIARHGLD